MKIWIFACKQTIIHEPRVKSKDVEGIRYLSLNLSIHFLASYYWGTGRKERVQSGGIAHRLHPEVLGDASEIIC